MPWILFGAAVLIAGKLVKDWLDNAPAIPPPPPPPPGPPSIYDPGPREKGKANE